MRALKMLSVDTALGISIGLLSLALGIGLLLFLVSLALDYFGVHEQSDLDQVAMSYIVFPFGPIVLCFALASRWASPGRVDLRSEVVKSQERFKTFKNLIRLINILFWTYLAFWTGLITYKWHWITYSGVTIAALGVLMFIYASIVREEK